MRGVTEVYVSPGHGLHPFLLTRLMRGVTLSQKSERGYFIFLLTRLMRGVTVPASALKNTFTFLLTRLMRGVTRGRRRGRRQLLYFYSHASCEA